MSDPWYVLSGIAVSAGVTWALRAAPFAMLAPLRHSALMAHIGERMPVGMMVILAVYTLRDTDPVVAASVGPAVLALAITIGLHLWRGSMTLSIFAGTAAYVLVTSVIAA
ncbi:AzlD domain-containing protein [Nocardioides sp. NPDC006273]|uniref:branched-chain amino acid transporter permease n=1 Tax=Nocardioides sp. NPDC006273 TaxID=3155598 RepID=UPI00339FE659